MDIKIIMNQMIIFFTLMLLGYLLNKIGIMNQEFCSQVTKLVLNVTMPVLILNSVLDESASLSGKEMLLSFALAIAMYVLLPIFSHLIALLIRSPKKEIGIYDFLGTYANIGFMGLPLVGALLGSTALVITAIFNIIFNVSAFSVGIFLICQGSEKKANFSLKKLLTPGISVSVLAIVVYLLGISLPQTAKTIISTVGGLTTPLAMMLIGSTLATMKWKEVVSDKHVYLFAVLRQIVLPLICFPLLKWMIQDTLLLSVTFIMLIMPAGNISVLFATNYELDAKVAAKGVFVTTLLSIITIPLLLSFCLGS